MCEPAVYLQLCKSLRKGSYMSSFGAVAEDASLHLEIGLRRGFQGVAVYLDSIIPPDLNDYA